MNKILNKAKEIKGSVITIGFDEQSLIIKELNKNKNINELIILTNDDKKPKSKKKRSIFSGKQINIKKLYKELRRNRYDYLICNFNTIIPFLRSFVKNSIKLSDRVCLFSFETDYDLEQLKYRYARYNAKISTIKQDDRYLFCINNKDVKIGFINSLLYWFKDIAYDITELIANIMIG